MRILNAEGGNGSSLCILGAGNLNDIRLQELVRNYAEIHLVDLDKAAVHAGLARHGSTRPVAVKVHAPVDLTGILDWLPADNVSGEVADDLCEVLADDRCEIPGAPYDVTFSAAVLTQLLQSIVDSDLGSRETIAVSLALRDKHLADLIRLTRPGGVFVLLTDVVSTLTAPVLVDAAPADLGEHMVRLVGSGNFFTGVNPYRVMALLGEDNRFRDQVVDARLLEPWLWQVTTDRWHLTVAIRAHRARL
jgi:hypothetical protein